MKSFLAIAAAFIWLQPLGAARSSEPSISPESATATWIVKPSAGGPIGPKDLHARNTLLQQIADKQAARYRQLYKITVPQQPTGLPQDYDVFADVVCLVDGEFNWVARIQIQVRGDHAQAKFIAPNGIRRRDLPIGSLDDLARQWVYASLTQRELIAQPEDFELNNGNGLPSGNDAEKISVEIVSRDPNHPLHVRTPAWNIRAGYTGISAIGVEAFAYCRLIDAVCSVFEEEHGDIARPTAAMRRDLVARLKRIPTPQIAAAALIPRPSDGVGPFQDEVVAQEHLPLEHQRRDDPDSFNARIDSQLAIAWCEAAALPELRRLKMSHAASWLSIATASDPSDLLVASLLDKEHMTYRWALIHTLKLPARKGIAVYLAALPRVMDEVREKEILCRLERLRPRAEELAAVRSLHDKTTSRSTKVSSAAVLLGATGQAAYIEYLQQQTFAGKQGDYDANLISQRALDALVQYSQRNPKYQPLPLVRSLLDRYPNDPVGFTLDLVDILAQHGDQTDVARLLKYCDHVSYVDTAVAGLSRLNPAAALDKARRQIDNFASLAKPTGLDYCLLVRPYPEVVFLQGDPSFVPSLERALAKSGSIDKEDPYTCAFHLDPLLSLIGYLKSEGVNDRARCGSQLAKRCGLECRQQLEAIHAKLIRQGADPALCKSLLLSPPPARPEKGLLDDFLDQDGLQ